MPTEDYARVLTLYRGIVEVAVKEFGGTVEGHKGDGVLCFVGYPDAHEYAAERAIEAAFLARDLVTRHEFPYGVRLQVRLGIAVGTVVVGHYRNSDLNALGDAPNVAALVQKNARVNSVNVEDSTRQLVGDLFEYSDFRSIAVEGAAPVKAWRVIGSRPVASRFEAKSNRACVAMLGRDDERQLLVDLWRRAITGSGQVALVSGEGGIGKSRLMAEAAGLARERDFRVLSATGVQSEAHLAFAGLHQLLRPVRFRAAGLPIVKHVTVLRADWEAAPKKVQKLVESKLKYPVFVKPANLGSSVGISKAHNRKELGPAIEEAAKFDRKIVIEQGVGGAKEKAREIECSVLGNDEPAASVPGEIVPGKEFYDYTAKYVDEGSQLIIPAKLSKSETKKVQDLAIAAFKAVDCSGLARVDFLMDPKTRKIYLNEINTMPGFTAISMYPKLWAASGLAYADLIDRLIQLGIERHEDKKKNQYTV